MHRITRARSISLSLLFVTSFFVSHCGSDTSTGDAVCEAGRVESCPCTGEDEVGTQTCSVDGSTWGACICVAEEDDDENNENNENDEDAGYGDTGGLGDVGLDCVPPVLGEAERTRATELYAMNCAACHGVNAEGTALGPELLEEVAEESNDEIMEVILEGDDDMPPIAIPVADALAITRYLVLLSSENGYDLSERCEAD